MRTQFLSLLLSAAAVVAMSAVSSAQLSKDQQEQSLGAESHVDSMTGHAETARTNYRR